MKLKILYIGRKRDIYCLQLFKFLKKQNIKLSVFWTIKGKNNLRKKIFKKNYDLILCYRSYLILRKNEIEKAKISAINIHPGPPKYRGVGCLNYALYKGEKKYGITFHLINEKIDNGKIIFFKEFLINKDKNVERLLLKTHNQCIKYSQMLIPKIIKDTRFIDILVKKFQMISWSNKIYNKDYLDSFYKISLNKKINNEFLKKINATYYKEFKPYIIINKKKFFLNEE